ncbi:MAG TPA: TonB-dependent receptor [Mucilaginibacter sp.]|jgi:TonB-linked SusC/RagA family outer membrane protein|nr:TonB-dependent receptor [Mucilaginibacter sp.]
MKRIFTISGLVLLFSFVTTIAFAQNITVTGKVLDQANSEALIGVSVKIKGTTEGTQTDVNGSFSINAPSNATLVFTYIGYAPQEVPLNGKNAVDVRMNASANELSQVVVIGYGTQKKIDNTGAVANVKGSDIAKEASTNVVSALQGKVAGVDVINNGQPGSVGQITIRGFGTVYGNTTPLYVVDGVWYDDISFLNDNDIESITVLKDASSLAIFGVRAGAGAIMITTKSGRKGKPTINYNAYAGWQSVTNQVQMANATQYATAINELYADNNITPAFSTNPNAYGTGTNWYDQILRNAFVTNHQISVNGGSDKYTYDYSFGYLDQDGIVKTNNYQRYTFHATNDLQVAKNVKIGFTANILSSESADIDNQIFHQMYTAAPIVPVFYSSGAYGDPADYNVGGGANYNPEATIDFFHQKSKNKELSGNVYGEWEIIKGLKFRMSFGGQLAQAEVRHYEPIYFATGGQQSTTSSLDVNHTENRNWNWDNTLTYDKAFKKHKFTVLLGYSAQKYRTSFADAFADSVANAQSGNLHTSFPAGAKVTLTYPQPSQFLDTKIGEFARVNYSYDGRFLINASIRRDGASEFWPHPYGWFPAIGGGWVISNESFMKDQHFFSNLKFRASYGQLGNANVPVNLNTLVVTKDPGQYTAIFGNPQTAYTGASINTVVPPTSTWEKSIGTDAGIEATILNDHLQIEAGYYNRTTQNAVFTVPIPGSTGENGPGGGLLANQADIRNRGFEFTLTWRQQINQNWFYSISPNLAINDNMVTRVISGNNPIYGGGNGITNGALATRTVVGQPIGEFFGYKVIGVFQNAQQIAGSAQPGAQPGDFIYQDTNNDGQISSTDRVNLGNPNPKYQYGINTNVKYKNFDLELDFQGRADVSIYNANIAERFGNENFSEDFYVNRWHGDGTSNTYPSVNIGSTANSAPNSFFVTSGAYFRLRNAQLGYTLPGDLLRKWKIQNIRLFANAQNAINIFGYKGFSPEVGGGPTNLGIDANVYPLYATYNFGVNVTF